MMKSDIRNNLGPMTIMLAVILTNTALSISFMLSQSSAITSTQRFALVVLEIALVILALRKIKRGNNGEPA